MRNQYHLAILYRYMLDKIISGDKTIEGRFHKVKTTPFGRIQKGDIVFLKETSGPVRGYIIVKDVKYYVHPSVVTIENILEKYGDKLCIDRSFRDKALQANYITLIFIDKVYAIPPVHIPKRDRRAWIIFDTQSTLFPTGDEEWKNQLLSALAER